MGDYEIRMRFEVDTDEEAMRQALTSEEGIAAWWSDTVQGRPGDEGGDLYVTFPDLPEPFHFRVDPGEHRVTWETQEFPLPIITPAWAFIIDRLRRYAETGEADPFAIN